MKPGLIGAAGWPGSAPGGRADKPRQMSEFAEGET